MTQAETADDVVSYLQSQGQMRMALIVSTLKANYEESRALNRQNVDACNALRAKYEPMFRYRSHKPPPDQDG